MRPVARTLGSATMTPVTTRSSIEKPTLVMMGMLKAQISGALLEAYLCLSMMMPRKSRTKKRKRAERA
jgi:hypothetical protein